MKSQNDKILKWLKKGKTITAIQALNHFGCFRLAARIRNLKDKGYIIDTDTYRINNKVVAKYKLNQNGKQSKNTLETIN